jgi:hypothetical protein
LPWRSRSTDSLHRFGYVVTDKDNSTVYYAPGLDVLLSNMFLEDHCFRLVADGPRVGMAFEPAPDRKRLSEIRGTIWLDRATSPALCGYTVAWVAAESAHGRELALEWIESKKQDAATAGWNTLSGLVALRPDDELDLKELKRLLARVAKTIHASPDPVRYAMNGFVIALGSYVAPLTDDAIAAARKIGTVDVDMGETACQVPDAAACIDKVRRRGSIGKKRKTVRC